MLEQANVRLTNFIAGTPAACDVCKAWQKACLSESILILEGIPSIRCDIAAESSCWESAHHLRLVEVQPNLQS